jgi:16S rRNA (cytidine1402-2'-O)-methyltransferase
VATLHLIPTPIAEAQTQYIDASLRDVIIAIKVWCVEELRTARRFLKLVDRNINIDELTFYVVNEHGSAEIQKCIKHLLSGQDVGLLSEAGCPAIADPGSELVAAAQMKSITVMPYVGPSSLLLALMGSGLNGNKFSYNAYVPAKNPDRIAAIRKLCEAVRNTEASQIFIEAPYRNDALMQDIVQHAPPQMKLSVACDLQTAQQFLQTKTIAEWKHDMPKLHKKPTVFILGL